MSSNRKVKTMNAIVRDCFAEVVGDIFASDLRLEGDMSADYGLTSLNKVLFLTSVCEEAGVPLTAFTEHDLADMRSLNDVVDALTARQGQEIQS